VESRWRAQVADEVRNEEWNFLSEKATELGVCPSKVTPQPEPDPSLKLDISYRWRSAYDPGIFGACASPKRGTAFILFVLMVNVDGKKFRRARIFIDSAVNQSIIRPGKSGSLFCTDDHSEWAQSGWSLR